MPKNIARLVRCLEDDYALYALPLFQRELFNALLDYRFEDAFGVAKAEVITTIQQYLSRVLPTQMAIAA